MREGSSMVGFDVQRMGEHRLSWAGRGVAVSGPESRHSDSQESLSAFDVFDESTQAGLSWTEVCMTQREPRVGMGVAGEGRKRIRV